MTGYEEITVPPTLDGDEWLLAVVVYATFRLDASGIKFFTDPSQPQQLAAMRYPAGHVVPAHRHLENQRYVPRTQEVLVVRSGVIVVSFYRSSGEFVATRTLRAGDVVHLSGGGHKVEVVEDADVLEIKTGPYYGRDKDKILLSDV